MHNLSLLEYQKGLQNKTFSALELVECFLERINKYDSKLNSFILVCADSARAQAKQYDEMRAQNKPLPAFAGVPIAYKDNHLTAGVATTCCSKALHEFIPPYNATVVQNLQNAGFVLVGKTNMDEFAMGGSNETSYFGPCKNPWDTTRVPGGSSGGSAASVVAGLCPFTTGSDTGGSIRQPASYCGITGIKPSYGVISRYGIIAFASSLDQVGPMARSAEDCAYLLSVMASFDGANDMTSVKQDSYDYFSALGDSIKGLKIGLPEQYFGDNITAGMQSVYQKVIDTYTALGAEFVSIDLPDVKYCVPAYYTIAPCEASSNLARFDSNLYGYRAEDCQELERMYTRSRSESFGVEVQRRILTGTYALSSGYYDAYYKTAQNIRKLIRHDFNEAFAKVDLILAPSAPTTAFKLGQLSGDPITMYQQDVFTIPVNLAELPSVSVPSGFVDNLPVGMQLIGPKFSESKLLNAAHQYQSATEWHLQTPTEFN